MKNLLWLLAVVFIGCSTTPSELVVALETQMRQTTQNSYRGLGYSAINRAIDEKETYGMYTDYALDFVYEWNQKYNRIGGARLADPATNTIIVIDKRVTNLTDKRGIHWNELNNFSLSREVMYASEDGKWLYHTRAVKNDWEWLPRYEVFPQNYMWVLIFDYRENLIAVVDLLWFDSSRKSAKIKEFYRVAKQYAWKRNLILAPR